MFLNESYYGKTPETLAIEQAFQNMQAVTKEEDTKDGAPMFMELCYTCICTHRCEVGYRR